MADFPCMQACISVATVLTFTPKLAARVRSILISTCGRPSVTSSDGSPTSSSCPMTSIIWFATETERSRLLLRTTMSRSSPVSCCRMPRPKVKDALVNS